MFCVLRVCFQEIARAAANRPLLVLGYCCLVADTRVCRDASKSMQKCRLSVIVIQLVDFDLLF